MSPILMFFITLTASIAIGFNALVHKGKILILDAAAVRFVVFVALFFSLCDAVLTYFVLK